MRKVVSVDCRDRRRGRCADGAQARRGSSAAMQTRASTRPDEGVQGHLGAQLRALYQKTLEEPIPQRFIELLRRSEAGIETGESDSAPIKDA